jgi:SNF2 family DNA or RNA helicase
MQRKWYQSILEKDIDADTGEQSHSLDFDVYNINRSNGQEGRGDAVDEYGYAGMEDIRIGMLVHFSFTYQLRKVACHPYLFDGAVS